MSNIPATSLPMNTNGDVTNISDVVIETDNLKLTSNFTSHGWVMGLFIPATFDPEYKTITLMGDASDSTRVRLDNRTNRLPNDVTNDNVSLKCYLISLKNV